MTNRLKNTTFECMIVALIGYMGAGKTSVGEKLSTLLGYEFIDLDEYIAEGEGLGVRDIFDQKSEAYFRKLEHFYLRSVMSLERVVVATGGGTPIHENNMDYLKAGATTIFLQASATILAQRLKSETESRPLLKDVDERDLQKRIQQMLEGRMPCYESADYTVHTDKKSVDEIAGEIMAFLS